jgi:hypothetical protein
MGCVLWTSLSLRMRGILWANLSLWMRIVVTTRRDLPLRRTRRSRHLRTRCWSPTPLGFRPGRVVLWSVLGEYRSVSGSLWSCAILRSPVRCSSVAGRYDAAPAEFRRLRSGRDWRLSLIHGSQQVVVRTGSALMPHLFRGWRHLPLADRCFLFGSRARHCSARTAVIADAIYRGHVVDYGCAVNVVNVGDVHVVDGLVVVKLPSSPIAAIVAATGILLFRGGGTLSLSWRTAQEGREQ